MLCLYIRCFTENKKLIILNSDVCLPSEFYLSPVFFKNLHRPPTHLFEQTQNQTSKTSTVGRHPDMANQVGLGLEITELRLGLPGENRIKKRAFSEIFHDRKTERKSQVVGWPPVCSYRKRNGFHDEETASGKAYVKVSMDGAPFLRKIDLGVHRGYHDLALALEDLFGCSGVGKALSDEDSPEFVPIYEDKDGDWMLVGDVPWEMFTESCKRLRVMKRSEAKGIDLQAKNFLKEASDDK
ncbi:hypothetical protein NMG60_11004972 [Bertholletia excelsa]